MKRESTVPTPPGLIAACHLLAAYEAARRIRSGDDIPDAAGYIRIRGEKFTRAHAALWASIPDVDPIDFARGIEPGLGGQVAAAPATVRTLPDGTPQRFLPGTGWATIHDPSTVHRHTNADDELEHRRLITAARHANQPNADDTDPTGRR